MKKTTAETGKVSFAMLGLAPAILESITEIGYEIPSPIQAEAIPYLLQGRDILGQAQTGTGKTAAFALPILSQIDVTRNRPQVLVLVPTRELAIQVAEAFQRYASRMDGFHVAPIYGGQDYRQQFRALNRGVHVVVGTPGRVMDHIRRDSLKLDQLSCLVLDEADEMLRMGFIDDVKWVLEQIPVEHQTALFSATMPKQIRKISEQHLKNPAKVSIEVKTTTAETVHQRYWMVSGFHKLEALTRILEVEETDGVIIFSRTKTMTVELSEKLAARGFAADALNGDIPQKMREQLVNKLKSGQLDILVATDVAARGLDVPRISHVINYDIPYDTESYVHRIGRTGRAGRTGDAILFVAPREKRMLHTIERATRQRIEEMGLPTSDEINSRRIDRFKQKITDALNNEKHLEFYRQIIESYCMEHDVSSDEIAAALASLSQGESLHPVPKESRRKEKNGRTAAEGSVSKKGRQKRKTDASDPARHQSKEDVAQGYQRYQLAVGRQHKAESEQILTAVVEVTGLFPEDVGTLTVHDGYSTIDLPDGMPRAIFRDLQKSWVCGQQLKIKQMGGRKKAGRKGGSGKKQPLQQQEGTNKAGNKGKKSPKKRKKRRTR